MGSLKGITIEIDGETTGLERALKQVNSKISETTRSLKEISKATKLDPGNADMVAQRQRNLAEAIQQTQQKFNILKNAATQANDALASGSISVSQYEALQRELSGCSARLAQFKNELNSLGSTNGMAGIVATGQSLQALGDKLTAAGAKMMPISMAAGAAAAACIKLGSDAEEAGSKVDAVFGSSAGTIHEFASDAVHSLGMTSAQAESAAGTFGGMATAMGIPAQAAAEMSMQLVQLAADMASFNNVDVETSANALRGVFTGEGEALKNLGVVMTESTNKSYAMSQGFSKTFDEMTPGEKAIVRLGSVLAQTAGQQGDFARTAEGTANASKTMSAAFKEAGASLGKAIAPAVNAVVNVLTVLADAFNALPKPIQAFVGIVLGLVAAIGPLVLLVGVFCSALGSIMTYAPLVVTALTAVGGAFVKLNVAMMSFIANPIVLIIMGVVAAIALLSLAIYEVVQHWDDISNAASSAMDSMKNKVANSKIGQALISDFEKMKESASESLDNIKNAFESDGLVGAVKAIGSEIKSAFSNAFNGLKTTTLSAMEGVKQAIQSAMSAAKAAASRGAEAIKSAIGAIAEVANNIGNAFQSLPSRIQQTLKEVGDSIKEAFENLAKKASQWGTDLVDNFTSGINNSKNKLVSAVNNLAQDVQDRLGFSEPDKGPLSNFHTYAPDMIDLWVKGVKDNMGKIQAVSDLMAYTMSPSNSLQSIAQNSADRTTSSINTLAENVGAMNRNTTVQVVLEGDAKGVFKLVRQENLRMVQSTGYHALA